LGEDREKRPRRRRCEPACSAGIQAERRLNTSKSVSGVELMLGGNMAPDGKSPSAQDITSVWITAM